MISENQMLEKQLRRLEVPALPAPVDTRRMLRHAWSANWGNPVLSEGNTTYCKICDKVISKKSAEFHTVINHMRNHLSGCADQLHTENLQDVHDYIILMDNARFNALVQKHDRKMVAAKKNKGQKMICDVCNKDITKTPDKAKHLSRHFAGAKLPVEWEKFLKVVEAVE